MHLDLDHRELLTKMLQEFDELFKDIDDISTVESRKNFVEKVQEDYEKNIRQKCHDDSRNFCSELLKGYLEIFKQDSNL